MNTYHINTACMSLALNGKIALERFKRSNAIEIHNGINVRFLPGTARYEIYTGICNKTYLPLLELVLLLFILQECMTAPVLCSHTPLQGHSI